MAQLVCSAKGCRQPATWAHLWNNPRLHTPERRKVWLACEAHRTTLADYLATRGFPVVVSALDTAVDVVPDAVR